MFTRFAKTIFGLLAYSPLFIILLIKNMPLKKGIILGLSIFFGILIISWIILKTVDGLSGEPINLKIDRDINEQYVGFIVTYIVPFIGKVETLNDMVSMSILIIVIFALYLSTSLFAVNPVLKLIFGYNLYLCMINGKESILLSKEILKRNEEIRMAYRVDESINLFVQQNRGENND